MDSSRKFADFSVGMSLSHGVHITAEMIAAYGDIVGDHNPLHTDAEYATPRFGGIIAHGTLLVGLFSAAMWRLLGAGAVARGFACKFRAPFRAGDDVQIQLKIIELVPKIRKVVIEGRAYVGTTVLLTTIIEALIES
jgi:acyl dehydratase